MSMAGFSRSSTYGNGELAWGPQRADARPVPMTWPPSPRRQEHLRKHSFTGFLAVFHLLPQRAISPGLWANRMSGVEAEPNGTCAT